MSASRRVIAQEENVPALIGSDIPTLLYPKEEGGKRGNEHTKRGFAPQMKEKRTLIFILPVQAPSAEEIKKRRRRHNGSQSSRCRRDKRGEKEEEKNRDNYPADQEKKKK